MTKNKAAFGKWVELNSGSPPMLVCDVDEDGYVMLCWRDEDGTISEFWIHPVCVKEPTNGYE